MFARQPDGDSSASGTAAPATPHTPASGTSAAIDLTAFQYGLTAVLSRIRGTSSTWATIVSFGSVANTRSMVHGVVSAWACDEEIADLA